MNIIEILEEENKSNTLQVKPGLKCRDLTGRLLDPVTILFNEGVGWSEFKPRLLRALNCHVTEQLQISFEDLMVAWASIGYKHNYMLFWAIEQSFEKLIEIYKLALNIPDTCRRHLFEEIVEGLETDSFMIDLIKETNRSFNATTIKDVGVVGFYRLIDRCLGESSGGRYVMIYSKVSTNDLGALTYLWIKIYEECQRIFRFEKPLKTTFGALANVPARCGTLHMRLKETLELMVELEPDVVGCSMVREVGKSIITQYQVGAHECVIYEWLRLFLVCRGWDRLQWLDVIHLTEGIGNVCLVNDAVFREAVKAQNMYGVFAGKVYRVKGNDVRVELGESMLDVKFKEVLELTICGNTYTVYKTEDLYKEARENEIERLSKLLRKQLTFVNDSPVTQELSLSNEASKVLIQCEVLGSIGPLEHALQMYHTVVLNPGDSVLATFYDENWKDCLGLKVYVCKSSVIGITNRRFRELKKTDVAVKVSEITQTK